ncbi:hypothetical protein TPA0906_38100 [Streptomyces olivaceus]|nr:hypothetical protein TPA0906_38100 [Streptomyces olivaceus]
MRARAFRRFKRGIDIEFCELRHQLLTRCQKPLRRPSGHGNGHVYRQRAAGRTGALRLIRGARFGAARSVVVRRAVPLAGRVRSAAGVFRRPVPSHP